MSFDMYGSMSGSSAWMMTPAWDAKYFTLLFAMWAVMMTGMMLPSAAPMILLFAGVVRQSDLPQAGRSGLRVCRRVSRRLVAVRRGCGGRAASARDAALVLTPMMTLVQ